MKALLALLKLTMVQHQQLQQQHMFNSLITALNNVQGMPTAAAAMIGQAAAAMSPLPAAPEEVHASPLFSQGADALAAATADPFATPARTAAPSSPLYAAEASPGCTPGSTRPSPSLQPPQSFGPAATLVASPQDSRLSETRHSPYQTDVVDLEETDLIFQGQLQEAAVAQAVAQATADQAEAAKVPAVTATNDNSFSRSTEVMLVDS